MPLQPAPNWGNTHDKACPVTEGRRELWQNFTAAISNGPDEHNSNLPDTHRDYLWGCVIEYCANGDEEVEQCKCPTHNTWDMIIKRATRIENWKGNH